MGKTQQIATERENVPRLTDIQSRALESLLEGKSVTAVELAEATAEELDVNAGLAFAERVLGDVARLWDQADAEDKRRLQTAFFPEGLTFDGSGFGTAVTCLAFMQMPTPVGQESGMVSPTGFESGDGPEPPDTKEREAE